MNAKNMLEPSLFAPSRGQALSTFSLTARGAGALAPFVTSLAYFWPPLPMLFLGVPALLASFLSQFQKETTGLALAEEDEGSVQDCTDATTVKA